MFFLIKTNLFDLTVRNKKWPKQNYVLLMRFLMKDSLEYLTFNEVILGKIANLKIFGMI